MQVLEHDGARLAFRVDVAQPEQEHLPLLVLHGLGSDGNQVRRAFPFLDRTVVAPDMPGHCGSSDASLGFDRFAILVLALLDHLGIQQADLAGISMGSGTSLAVALRAPDRVRRLVLVRPAWLDCPALPQLRLVAELGRRIAAEGVEAAGTWLEADGEMRSMADRLPLAAVAIRALLSRTDAVRNAPVLPCMVADRPFQKLGDLRAIRCPSIVLGNDDDPLHPAGLAHTLADAIPAAVYEHLPPRYLRPDFHAAILARVVHKFLEDGATIRSRPILAEHTPC